MLDFATPLGRAGQAIGSGAGAVLGTVSDVLSAPRRGLMNLLGLPESGADLLHQATGMDQDSFLTHALGTGFEMLTDPLTYLGGAIGRLGAKVFAPGLERAALARGPNYAGGAEKLMQQFPKDKVSADVLLEALQGSPHLPGVLKEIPPGSTYLNNGAEALVYKTPAGDVLRIEPQAYNTAASPESANILQPTRAGIVGDARVERQPLVDTAAPYEMGPAKAYRNMTSPLKEALEQEGLDFADSHLGNVALLHGRPVVIDPGAVMGSPADLNPLGQLQQRPGRIQNWLLDALGADEQVQQHLAEQAAMAPKQLPTTPVVPGYRGPNMPLDSGRPQRFAETPPLAQSEMSGLGRQLDDVQNRLRGAYANPVGPSQAFDEWGPLIKQRQALVDQLKNMAGGTDQLQQFLDARNLHF